MAQRLRSWILVKKNIVLMVSLTFFDRQPISQITILYAITTICLVKEKYSCYGLIVIFLVRQRQIFPNYNVKLQ